MNHARFLLISKTFLLWTLEISISFCLLQILTVFKLNFINCLSFLLCLCLFWFSFLVAAFTKRNQIFHWNKEMHLELHLEFLPLNLYLSPWIHTRYWFWFWFLMFMFLIHSVVIIWLFDAYFLQVLIFLIQFSIV